MLSSLTRRSWLIMAISLLVTGVVLLIGGCIIASIGFGLSAADMYDYMNLALRITGMLMLHFSFLPLAVSVCCWVFFSWSKREYRKQTKQPVYAVGTEAALPMTQYPYSASAVTNTRIYNPQQPSRYGNFDPDDSSAPLNFSDSTTHYPVDTSSPQVVTSASSFDDDPTTAKGRRPKKEKKSRGVAASVDEKQAMAASSSYKT